MIQIPLAFNSIVFVLRNIGIMTEAIAYWLEFMKKQGYAGTVMDRFEAEPSPEAIACLEAAKQHSNHPSMIDSIINKP